jgi:hypothetical protein
MHNGFPNDDLYTPPNISNTVQIKADEMGVVSDMWERRNA